MHSIENTLFHTITGPIWKKIGVKHRHGINLILSCLHSENSSGIGEFLDLIPLIDWCKKVHMEVIQLLPLYDSGNDPSPYNALSSRALNPIYLSLSALPHLDLYPDLQKELLLFKPLNETKKVEYNTVLSSKLNFLKNYYAAVKDALLNTPDFTAFYQEQSYWLTQYALYKVLKDRLAQNSWASWPAEFKHPTKEQFDSLVLEYQEPMQFYIFLQHLCFQQLKKVKNYATSKYVLLKGDIPILISDDSCDVWHHQEFFDLTLAAGAPPDVYNAEGQYWGFPLFHWDILKKDQYRWWKQRLKVAAEFYDLYRIDHVVGFYRIWGIPLNNPASEGQFYPQDPSLWLSHGEAILKMMVGSSTMLPIAEDLGIVSEKIRNNIHSLGICGTNVIRWQREYQDQHAFIPINNYPVLGMTTVSTHDSETLQQWYKEFPQEAADYAAFKNWEYNPDLSTEKRKEILYDSHHSTTLFHINLIQEYLALFPELIWSDPSDERINIPGIVLPTNWTYRTLPTLEQIVSHKPLQETIREILDTHESH